MFNYRLTISEELANKLNNFDAIVRQQATRSLEVTTEKKRLEEIRDNTENSEETIKEAIEDIKKLEEAWKVERKGYDLQLFGGKDEDGNKVGGYCDSISKDFYKAYTTYITECNAVTLKDTVRKFLEDNTLEDAVRDRAVAEFTSELLIMLGGKFNSNKKLAEGENFISTMNKKTFKKYLFGSILDIIKKTTLKVENSNK